MSVRWLSQSSEHCASLAESDCCLLVTVASEPRQQLLPVRLCRLASCQPPSFELVQHSRAGAAAPCACQLTEQRMRMGPPAHSRGVLVLQAGVELSQRCSAGPGHADAAPSTALCVGPGCDRALVHGPVLELEHQCCAQESQCLQHSSLPQLLCACNAPSWTFCGTLVPVWLIGSGSSASFPRQSL